MLRNIGLFSLRAFWNASSPHAYQSTGLCACCSRYGDFSRARRFVNPILSFVVMVVTFWCGADACCVQATSHSASSASAHTPAVLSDTRLA